MSISLAEPLLILFAIMAIGSALGNLPLRGLTLGSAGVLFVALIFGHYGLRVQREVMDLGLLLFVYAVGLQAGPRFFRTFRRQGLQFVLIGLVTVAAGAVAAVILALVMHLPPELATGLFTGALTNTPALAAAIDVVERIAPGQSGDVSAGYGIAYPYSMLSVVLLIQVLPRLLRRDVRREEETWLHQQKQESPALVVKKFIITNPNCDGKRISEINPRRMSEANISRVRRGDQVFAATTDVVLRQGDVVMVVGPEVELEKMRFLLGEETDVPMDINTSVSSVDVDVTEDTLTGKTLAELRVWERYGVVITRLRREGQEVVPNGRLSMEIGDSIHVVGEREAVDNFVRLVHGAGHKADETNMVPFLAGLVLGILLGSLSIELNDQFELKLGLAGGVFVVSLLVGHFGRIGRLRLYVPTAAKNLSRELGLMLFLAGAGTNAGARIVPIIQERGWSLVLAGAIITTVSILVGLLLTHYLYRLNLLATMGALCAGMTNPPGLAAANAHSSTNLPTLAYASVYPVALITKIVLAQVLIELLHVLLR